MTTDFSDPRPMQSATPIDPLAVCTLPPADLRQRLDWIRAEILPHALAGERLSDGLAWELHDAPGLAEKLDQLVALERECCSGIDFTHRKSRVASQRRLEVRGIDPAAPLFANLGFAEPTASRLGARIARSLGLGALVSLFVCCVLPIGLAALLGAAFAAPFASLDNPWVIASAALATGMAAFAWQSRRRAAGSTPEAAAPVCGTDC